MDSKIKYLISVCIILLSGCGSKITTNTKVVSPNGKFVAISTTHLAGGAAGSVSDVIYVVKKGQKYTDENIIFRSLNTKGLDIFWSKKNTLAIVYSQADIILFYNNIFYDKESNSYKVEVILEKKVSSDNSRRNESESD